ncbi:MAG: hypothetical protein QXF25_01480 [Candidatus Pacearchaeota archaeon]
MKKREIIKNLGKKGQVTLFIIFAIAIVGIIAGYGIFRYYVAKIPTKFESVENYFLDCVKIRLEEGVSLLGQRAGYIYPPVFEPGSEEWPTSNTLGFMGEPIPYWFYVSGNDILKEKVPTIKEMEDQLSKYLRETLPLCDFSEFLDKGFDVSLKVNQISTNIRENKVKASVKADLSVSFEEDKTTISTHETEIQSKIGKFYNLATKIYNKEKEEAFLENFALDIVYLYAPTTEAELSCTPKVWLLENISQGLKEAFESNFLFLNPKARNKYYALDINTDESLRFLYSRDWPTKIYTPNDNGLLVAKPIGNQKGLGVLGFCFLNYHFVYDINFPILVQIYDAKEFFQFPVNVLIRGNKPRQPLEGSMVQIKEESVCKYKPTKGKVYTYDSDLKPIEADIEFKCFSESCLIGKTKISGNEAILEGNFPACVNGFVVGKAEGYTIGEDIVSSNEEFESVLILDKLYKLNLDLKLEGRPTTNNIMIYFESEKNSQSVYWPMQKSVELAEGNYNITAYVYSNGEINLPSINTKTCVDVPYSGIGGLLGMTKEKCFDVNVPEQKLYNVIIGGGKSEEYFLSNQIQNANTIEISITGTQTPKTMEDIQDIYNKIERNKLVVSFK